MQTITKAIRLIAQYAMFSVGLLLITADGPGWTCLLTLLGMTILPVVAKWYLVTKKRPQERRRQARNTGTVRATRKNLCIHSSTSN